MTATHGGPAFPCTVGPTNEDTVSFTAEPVPAGNTVFYGGMTLRDYFAAEAIQLVGIKHNGDLGTYENTAAKAYRLADAMLAERLKP